MATLSVAQAGCRSCSFCAEICPTQVFDWDDEQGLAVPAREQDCIGCMSCAYICPSRCLTVSGVERQKPFHWLEENAAIVERLLQNATSTVALSSSDIAVAVRDVSVRLAGLGASLTETMGRGQKVVGRKAGQLAAEHLPEMYDGRTLSDVLSRMQRRFAGCFDFRVQIGADQTQLSICFYHCALSEIVKAAGQSEGSAVLCMLFHEYWAGLLGAFTHHVFTLEDDRTSNPCTLKLRARS